MIVLDRRPLVLDPIPLHLDAAGSVRVHAQLLESLSEPTLIVTRPDGSAETLVHVKQGAELDHTLSLTEGMWGIEIMGTGPHGPSVLANITVEVGTVLATPKHAAKRDEVAPRDEKAFAREVERLISLERAQRGLTVLERDAVLDQIALLHSTDMHDHSFFGHVSASTGGPGDRALRGGARAWRLHENVSRGYTPRDVHEGLMNSPGHRKAILLPDADMLGLGVVSGYEGGAPVFFVTELFGQAPHGIALEAALEHVARRIGESRSAQNLSPVIPDTRLSSAAQNAAARFFTTTEGSDAEQQAILNELMQKARAPRGAHGMTARLYLGSHPDDLPIQDEMLDPKVRWLGIGVAQGEHARTGAAGLAVVVLLAH